MDTIEHAPFVEFDLGSDKEALQLVRESMAIEVALQSGVLRECPVHFHLFYDDRDPRPAFELLLKMRNERLPGAMDLHGGIHEMIDTLSEVISNTAAYCLQCRYGKVALWEQGKAGITDSAAVAAHA